jgi:VIT1/CCC1 family predicted Fe2+/Mn2+ transporter
VVGAELSPRIVLILGPANLVGDGFSMAASNFSGTRAERDEYARLRAMEGRHVDLVPEGEREEVREIYRRKGFRGEDLERAVGVVTASRERWIETMMAEEHGQPKMLRVAWKAALSTFAAFLLCGAVPLLPFTVEIGGSFGLSLAATALVFFGIGTVKSRWSVASWWRSGLETLAVGLAAAGIAFAVGFWLKGLV